MLEVRKKLPMKPKEAPNCHMVKPSMPMSAKKLRMISPKKHPTIQPTNAPISVDPMMEKKKKNRMVKHPLRIFSKSYITFF